MVILEAKNLKKMDVGGLSGNKVHQNDVFFLFLCVSCVYDISDITDEENEKN